MALYCLCRFAMKRLFAAILPPDPVREAAALLQQKLQGMALVPPPNFHLTLKFLGAVPEGEAVRIQEALRSIQIKSFFLEPFGVGCFPSPQAPRSVWLGFERVHPRLFQLRKAVNDALLRLRIEPDAKSYQPHLTLARCEPRARQRLHPWLKKHAETTAPAFKVDAFHLMESRMAREGVHYIPVEPYKLAE
jgi:2'-5' RNA ligase